MSQTHVVSVPRSTTRPGAVRIPLREIVPWAVFTTVLALLVLFFVTTEAGAVSLVSDGLVHEFVHDGRHLLAFPCH
ncbi:putative cobalt transporter subunit (CbtB) [Prauserella aidingensis]|uniref:CbtB domain-containing protein n=1 Tax=Prauserella aidingensis TaxID=387890 RepID=UPI0020A26D16|nr:CbtB-domain containing protein [Prauserella aidingensis]MCP2254443.1 putative cobalt transporter subunit (CbtB) [Prauserella aidingensis]